MRSLITGIGGFVGRHLLDHLRAEGDDVLGLARAEDVAGLPGDIELFQADLRERDQVQRALVNSRPEVIYHLAAQSSAAESVGDPWGTLGNNLRAQMNLLETMVAVAPRARVLVVGSSDEYGQVRPDEVPTHEDVPLRPVTPYAVSKVGQDVMAYQYFAQHGLQAIRVRPFSHTGPGHDPRFVIPSFARQIAGLEREAGAPLLKVGNLEVHRDFTDVRDVVRAYRLLVLHGAPGEVYNVGSGSALLLRDVLDSLVALSSIPVKVAVDPSLLRPSDVPRQQANIDRLQSLTEWQPRIPWRVTLEDTLEYWRARVGAKAAVSRTG